MQQYDPVLVYDMDKETSMKNARDFFDPQLGFDLDTISPLNFVRGKLAYAEAILLNRNALLNAIGPNSTVDNPLEVLRSIETDYPINDKRKLGDKKSSVNLGYSALWKENPSLRYRYAYRYLHATRIMRLIDQKEQDDDQKYAMISLRYDLEKLFTMEYELNRFDPELYFYRNANLYLSALGGTSERLVKDRKEIEARVSLSLEDLLRHYGFASSETIANSSSENKEIEATNERKHRLKGSPQSSEAEWVAMCSLFLAYSRSDLSSIDAAIECCLELNQRDLYDEGICVINIDDIDLFSQCTARHVLQKQK